MMVGDLAVEYEVLITFSFYVDYGRVKMTP